MKMMEMRVVHVAPYFYPDALGGVETHLLELSKYLAKRGLQVTVYSCGERCELWNGVEVVKLPHLDLPEIRSVIPPLRNPFPPQLFFKILKEHDLIHVHGQEYITSFLATLATKLQVLKRKIPLLLTIHNTGYAFQEYPVIKFLRQVLNRTAYAYIINSADVVIAPTKEALEYLGNFRSKIEEIPYGIDFSRFNLVKKPSEYVLFIGRLHPLKGPEYFIKAAYLVLKKTETTFVLAGDGVQRMYLQNLARVLGINDRVRFLGPVSYERVPEILSKAAVFVAPYNAGYTLLEAAASETPIVAAKLKWNESLIEGGALFVKPRSIEELADGILEFLENTRLARSFAEKARALVERKRNWNFLIDEYIRLYSQLTK